MILISGAYDLRERDQEFTAKAKNIRVHPRYEKTRSFVTYNFALIEMDKPVVFSLKPNIRPICLPDRQFEDNGNDGGVVAGWGDTKVEYTDTRKYIRGKSSRPGSVLQKLSVRFVRELIVFFSSCNLFPVW